jgi:thymidine kinase
MFHENKENRKKAGWIEVIAGSMFSGKTEELIRRIRRAQYAQQKVEIFKPAVDTRYSKEDVVSHNEISIQSTAVTSANTILMLTQDADVIGIDEAQFFDEGIIDVCNELANQGKRVIVAGLDMDFKGKPFGPMPGLFAIAEDITKVHAICLQCGDLAQYSHRKVPNQERVLLGETDTYEPLCRTCYLKMTKPQNS